MYINYSNIRIALTNDLNLVDENILRLANEVIVKIRLFDNRRTIVVNIYLFKVNNGNTKKRCKICSKLTIKTTEQNLASFWCVYC